MSKPSVPSKKPSSSKKRKVLNPKDLQRKHLDQRLQLLHRRVALLEKQLQQIEDPRFYRTCIFGSARIKAGNKIYEDVVNLAQLLAANNIDILTGGGPGLMEAANKGAQAAREKKQNKSRSYGMTIELDFEPVPNSHLDIKRHHVRFSSRLDDFMRLSHSIIVTPGGIGTLLELFFSWQLIQVRHLSPRPIILLDKSFWEGLLQWVSEVVLQRGLISPQDLNSIKIVDDPKDAVSLILQHREDHSRTLAALAKKVEL